MNSSVLVSGFVVVGVGAMAVMFNPFGSSEDTSPNPTSTYQASADLNKASTPSPVSATSDPEPFVWENKKETVASSGILDDLKDQDSTKKIAKVAERPRGLAGISNKASKDLASKEQQVSTTDSNFGDQVVSTVDEDLSAFFGHSKPSKKATITKPVAKKAKAPATKPATKVAKAVETKPAASKVTTEPVRVASKPSLDLDTAKPSTSWPTQEEKTSPKKNDEMFTFAPRGENQTDDAPMLAPVKSKDLDSPAIEPVNSDKISKTESSTDDISGSLDSVMVKPAVAGPVVKEFNIKNPLQTRLPVTFLANGKKISLKPGQHYRVRQSEAVQVKFSRGGSFGFSEKSLSEGNYEFSVTRKDGWKLTQ